VLARRVKREDEQYDPQRDLRVGRQGRVPAMRSTNGQLHGHPERGTESKYLLVSLARCQVCGAGLSVRSRSHGRRRVFYYVCTACHLKGASVCPNSQEVALKVLDARVLAGIGDQILSPRVLGRVLRRTLERWDEPEPAALDVAHVRAEVQALDRELTNLTAALAGGSHAPSVLAAIEEREGRRAALLAQLDGQRVQAQVRVSADEVERVASEKLAEWRDMLTKQTPIARQVIRKLFSERLLATPCDAEGQPVADPREADYVRITGTATLAKFFLGILVPKGMASPTGTDRRWKVRGDTREAA